MEKLYSFFNNLYNSDSRIMLYVYIAMAVVAVILILVITISSISNRITRKKRKKLADSANQLPSIETIEIVESLVLEKEEIKTEVIKEEIAETKPAITEIKKEEQIIEIKPIPEDKPVSYYDKPLEENIELDLTRPIPRVTSATDLLNEFLNDNKSLGISTDELNKPLPKNEKQEEPIYSSVFLDKKAEEIIEKEEELKSEINLVLTPIEPEKIEPVVKDLILNPKVLKSNDDSLLKEEKPDIEIPVKKEEKKNKNIVKEESQNKNKISKEEDSLDTKVDIFSHESLLEKTLDFDPFEPKSQEDLLGPKVKEEKVNKEAEYTNSPVVLTTSVLKDKLSELRTRASQEDIQSIDDTLKEIGLDELPNISDEIEEDYILRR